MKGMRLRGVATAAATLLAAITAAIIPVGSASATDYEHSFGSTVDQVLVNRYGGITISGTLDCTAAVADLYGGAANIPADTTVLVSKSWTATQYVGRNKVVTASYDSGIASVCYTNDPVFMGDAAEAPWPWSTLYAYPVGETQWVYSSTGKFGTGPIHVELTLEGVPLTVGEDTHYFYDFSGWNLRATRVK
ncbi:MAG: hypothetical protein WDA75_25825 [Candidatus Latescibacterota bacterium]|jgi:hypothetical protein